MRRFFYGLVFCLGACQSSFEVDFFDEPSDITISIVQLDQSIHQHQVKLHTPLMDIWHLISCEDCDDRVHNPNRLLKDGDVIVQQAYVQARISINTATLEELIQLPSIGPALAQRILDFREHHGYFQTLEEIMLVRGIKEGIFNKIKAHIRL